MSCYCVENPRLHSFTLFHSTVSLWNYITLKLPRLCGLCPSHIQTRPIPSRQQTDNRLTEDRQQTDVTITLLPTARNQSVWSRSVDCSRFGGPHSSHRNETDTIPTTDRTKMTTPPNDQCFAGLSVRVFDLLIGPRPIRYRTKNDFIRNGQLSVALESVCSRFCGVTYVLSVGSSLD